MAKKFYITTPIYYPNDIPHIGHAYTTMAADVLARWNKLIGKDVFFLTGTDEHGKKMENTAKENKKGTKEFVDELIPKFKDAWKKLNIDYDFFIRTTDKEHEKVVKEVLQKVYDKKDIYLGQYEGYYCTGCEAYYTEKDLVDGCCPIHKKKIELLKEESYFFKLSKYQKKLLDFYEKNPEFILPKSRSKEIVNRVKEGLNDLSISRTSFDWGIKLPFDEKHIAYVWFDALLNYYSATRAKGKEKYWPADLHLIGKDIIWFHTVYWPAMLMSAGIDLPKSVFAHGWWTLNNEKISKSRGKVINVDELISIGGVDSARYFLFRNTVFGEDGDFSEQALIDRHNNELANKLGNLISRVSSLIEKNGIEKCENKLLKKLKLKEIEKLFESYEFDKILNEIFAFIDVCNEYVQNKKPWETKDKKVLYELADSIKAIAILLYSFIPSTSEKIAKQFGFDIKIENIKKPLNEKNKIVKGEILFTKI
jgi:methionyl-tRNA synthetase